MKSQLLAGKLREIFGGDGEPELKQLLVSAAGGHPVLAQGVSKFLDVADGLLTQFSGMHKLQTELSGDAFSDWNLKSGQIDSGRTWKMLLGYANEDVGDTILAWRRLVHPDDLSVLDAAIAAHTKGKTRFFQSECRSWSASSAYYGPHEKYRKPCSRLPGRERSDCPSAKQSVDSDRRKIG